MNAPSNNLILADEIPGEPLELLEPSQLTPKDLGRDVLVIAAGMGLLPARLNGWSADRQVLWVEFDPKVIRKYKLAVYGLGCDSSYLRWARFNVAPYQPDLSIADTD